MSWSRKNSTLCLSSSARISAISPGSRAATPRWTSPTSAPIEQVSGSTRGVVLRAEDFIYVGAFAADKAPLVMVLVLLGRFSSAARHLEPALFLRPLSLSPDGRVTIDQMGQKI